MAQLQVIVNKLNKRGQVPSVLPDPNSITGQVFKDYTFQGDLAATNTLGNWYKDRDGNFYWGNGLAVVQPAVAVTTPPVATPPVVTVPAIDFSNLDLPVSHAKCLACADWMKTNFEDGFNVAVTGTVFEKELLYAIACQETAIYWSLWINDHTPAEILGRCVFDASGDANGSRSAFPKNTAAFIDRYGQELADMLIAEANATRAWRSWGPKQWVYAGYGIFQYDIQAILTDANFFEQKSWYTIEACLDKVIKELTTKWNQHPGDLFSTVKAYNGSGPKAENYAKNVFQFLAWIKAGV